MRVPAGGALTPPLGGVDLTFGARPPEGCGPSLRPALATPAASGLSKVAHATGTTALRATLPYRMSGMDSSAAR